MLNSIFILIFALSTLIPTNYVFAEYDEGWIISTVKGIDSNKQFYEIYESHIINNVREEHIFPDDPLTYKLIIYNPYDFTREIKTTLILEKGDIETRTENSFNLHPNDVRVMEIPFHLKELGAYSITLELLLDTDKTQEEREKLFNITNYFNHRLDTVFVDVQSPLEKLQADLINSSITTQALLVIATISLVLITFWGIKKTHRQMEKQSKQTEKNLEITSKQLELIQTELLYKIKPTININFHKIDYTKTPPVAWFKIENKGKNVAQEVECEVIKIDGGRGSAPFDLVESVRKYETDDSPYFGNILPGNNLLYDIKLDDEYWGKSDIYLIVFYFKVTVLNETYHEMFQFRFDGDKFRLGEHHDDQQLKSMLKELTEYEDYKTKSDSTKSNEKDGD